VVIAHGRYVTNDLLLATTMFLSSITWAAYLENRSPRELLVAGLALGLALASKFSALILLPVLTMLYIVRWWQEKGESSRLGMRHWFVSMAVVGVVSAGVLLAAYQFQIGTLSEEPSLAQYLGENPEGSPNTPRISSQAAVLLDPETPVGKTVHWIARSVPIPAYRYVVGFFRQVNHGWRGHSAYLLGRRSTHGFLLYFPVAFVVKTSMALLFVLCLSLALVLRRAPGKGWLAALRKISLPWYVVSVPPTIYSISCLASSINIGIRHLLPIYPFLFLFAGAALFCLPPARFRRAVQAAGLALAALLICESVSAYPEYLAFFNRAVGGPENGPRYLLDSNVDWGQNLKKLKAYLDAQGLETVCLDYFGTADPSYYGIQYVPIDDGRPPKLGCPIAVSVHSLYGRRDQYKWLLDKQPTAMIGYGIYVYD